MTPEHQHVEVVLVLRPGADARTVAEWLAGRGLQATPLQAGLLAAGEAAAVRAAFGAGDLDALTIPEPLREHVESAATVPPKGFGDRSD